MRVVNHRVRVAPVQVYAVDPRLAVEVRRVVGYRAFCSCGYVSPTRPTVMAARTTHQEHAAGH